MSAFARNLHVCHACPSACAPPRAGACACAANGRDIAANAAGGVCPRGLFSCGDKPTPPAGLGDTVKALADATGLAAVARAVERVTGRPCGCAKRQALLNRLVPYRRRPPESES